MRSEATLYMDDDPWNRKRKEEPPGVDEILSDIFGKDEGPGNFLLPLLVIGCLGLLASGFFIVSPPEQAVVLRFGKVVRVVGPGPNWVIPLVETRHIVNTQKIGSYNYHSEMLTSDESYADVDVTVFYRIKDPRKFLFNDIDPIDSLGQSTASALRQVVGNTELDAILTDGRIEARDEIQIQVERIMSVYDNGVEITDTKLQDARAPQLVKAAFDDIIQAREDYNRFIMDAEGYRNKVIPYAQGQAKRIENQGRAEHARLINDAYAKVAGFDALVAEYKKSPEIIRNQLFFSTMQSLYSRTKKIFIGSEGNLNVLPLDKLLSAGESNE
jgi:membrane protease subunit HflK